MTNSSDTQCQSALILHVCRTGFCIMVAVLVILTRQVITVEASSSFAQVESPDSQAKQHFKQAVMRHQVEQFDKAIEEYWHAVTLKPDFAMAYRGLGNAYVDSGNADEALQRFDQLLAVDPENSLYLYAIGNVHYQLGNYDTAMEAFALAIEKNSDLAIAYNNLAAIYGELGDRETQEKLIRQAINLDPSLTFAQNHLISFLSSSFSPSQIVEIYEGKLSEQSYGVHVDEYQYMVAVGYFQLGEIERANREYQKVVDNYPQSILADNALLQIALLMRYRAEILGEKEQKDEIWILETAIEQYPNSDQMYALYAELGRVHMTFRNFEQAEVMIRIATNDYPQQGVAIEGDFIAGKISIYVSRIFALRDAGQCNKAISLAENELLSLSMDYHSIQGQLIAYEAILTCLNLLDASPDIIQEYAEQMLHLAQEQGVIANEVEAYIILAETHDRRGDYEKTIDIIHRLLDLIPSIGNQEVIALIYMEIPKYLIESRQIRDYEKALTLLTKAEELLVNASRPRERDLASVYNSMSILHQRLGNYEKAINFSQKSIAIMESLNMPFEAINQYFVTGEIYQLQGKYDLALKVYLRALELAEQYDRKSREVEVRWRLGSLYGRIAASQGNVKDFDKVILEYEKALEIAADTFIADETITKLYHNLALAYAVVGKHREAIEIANSGVEYIEQVRQRLSLEEYKTWYLGMNESTYEILIRNLWSLGEEADELGNSAEASSYWQEAYLYLERSKSRALLDIIGNSPVTTKSSTNSDLMKQERDLMQEIQDLGSQLRREFAQITLEPNDERIVSLNETIDIKRRDYENVLSRLKFQNPEYASLRSINPLNLAEIQALLDDRTVLLEYYVVDSGFGIFLITNTEFHAVGQDIDQEELVRKIEYFRRNLTAQIHPMDERENLVELYNLLIGPVEQYLPRRENQKAPYVLGIIPYGPLHYLPFQALTDGERYLIEDYTLFYAPSASVLQFLAAKQKGEPGKILIVGSPIASSMPLLKYAEQEAQDIAEIVGVQPIVGEAATETRFRQEVGGARVVHISAHGVLEPSNPLFSSLRFTPDEQEDGRLEVHEIYDLDLSQADLVTLSACNTQLGERVGGDELVGLTRGFIYAGTPSVVTSLWAVDDLATSELMTRFYTHLSEGTGKADALREAQLDMLASEQFSHPYFWAAFDLVGDYTGTVALSNVSPTSASQLVPSWTTTLQETCKAWLSFTQNSSDTDSGSRPEIFDYVQAACKEIVSQ